MKIITLPCKLAGISNVILFTESLKDDYLFNHQLSIVSDMDDAEDIRYAHQYDQIPDTTIASDRKCSLKVISVQKGYYSYE